MRILPGDVVSWILSGGGEAVHSPEVREVLRQELGLNESLVVQYLKWLWSMLTGEFGGQSLVNGQPISALVSRQFPVTILLASYTVLLSIIVSVPLGVLSAWRKNRWQDYLIRLITIPGQSLPSFFTALLLLLGLLVIFQWSPPIVYTNPWEDIVNHLQIIIWPVLILAWEHSSHISRVTRAYMLDVMQEDYIRTARAKGLPQSRILFSHELRNALVPTITVLGLQLGGLLSGALILESIFGIPGIGRGIVQAALVRDYTVIQTFATLLVFIMLSVNLVIDIIYRLIDPRISYFEKSTLRQRQDLKISDDTQMMGERS
jgi:ABC-type dipeptide/oligopeptide/nickel transport system permease component